MDILNVIEVKNNDVVDITSFSVTDIQLMDDTIDDAERFFVIRLRSLNVINEDDINNAIEDGCYHGSNWSLSLIWSYVND